MVVYIIILCYFHTKQYETNSTDNWHGYGDKKNSEFVEDADEDHHACRVQYHSSAGNLENESQYMKSLDKNV